MNNLGQVVVPQTWPGDTTFHGLVSSQSTGMQDIPPIPGDTYSVARAINDLGVMSGLSLYATVTTLHTFVVVDGGRATPTN